MTCLITNDEYHDHTLLDKDRMWRGLAAAALTEQAMRTLFPTCAVGAFGAIPR